MSNIMEEDQTIKEDVCHRLTPAKGLSEMCVESACSVGLPTGLPAPCIDVEMITLLFVLYILFHVKSQTLESYSIYSTGGKTRAQTVEMTSQWLLKPFLLLTVNSGSLSLKIKGESLDWFLKRKYWYDNIRLRTALLAIIKSPHLSDSPNRSWWLADSCPPRVDWQADKCSFLTVSMMDSHCLHIHVC